MTKIGKRICIVGLTASGKSTLADRIGRKKGIPILHLDQLYHVPNTQWVGRPREDFHRDHDAFIQGPAWVIDGTYTKCLPQRLKRADTLIIIQSNRWRSLCNYLKRTFGSGEHMGLVDGAKEQLSWAMTKWVLRSPKKRYAQIETAAALHPHLQVIRLHSFKQIDRFVEELLD